MTHGQSDSENCLDESSKTKKGKTEVGGGTSNSGARRGC